MRITRIDFDDRGLPDEVTARFSMREVAFLSSVLGGMTTGAQNEVSPDGAVLGAQLTHALDEHITRYYASTEDALR